MMEAVSPAEVRRIAALENPVLRNLEITYAYSRLAAALTRRGERGRELVHVRDLGLAPGRARRSAARTRSTSCRTGCCATARCCTRSRPFGRWLLRRGLFDRGVAARAADEPAAHAVRRRRAGLRRGRARQPQGLRGDRLRVRALPRDARPRRRSSPACATAIRPTGRRCCAPPSRATPATRRPAGAAAGQPRDRPARADPPAARDPRGDGRRLHDQGGPRPAAVPGRAPAHPTRGRDGRRARPSARSTRWRAS